jgi:hypothetical protein
VIFNDLIGCAGLIILVKFLEIELQKETIGREKMHYVGFIGQLDT